MKRQIRRWINDVKATVNFYRMKRETKTLEDYSYVYIDEYCGYSVTEK